MNKLAELRARLAALKSEGTKIVDAAEASDDGTMSAEQSARFTAIKDELTTINAAIDQQIALDDARKQMDAIDTGATGTVPAAGDRSPALANQVNDLDPARTFGFKDLAEFGLAVKRAAPQSGGTMDKRLGAAPTNVHEGGGGDGEGFMIPPEYSDRIFEVVSDFDELGPLVDEEPTAKREVKMLADETTPWGATGVQASWRAEGSQMTGSKLLTQSRTCQLHELYSFVLATDELLEDAPRMANRLTDKAGQAIAYTKNRAFVYGTGVGQPLGWFGSGAEVVIAKESGQDADTIVVENVLKMYQQFMPVAGDRGMWLANSNILTQLATMTIGDQPVYMPPGMMADAPHGALLGLPLMYSQFAKTLGDKGDLQLVSPKGYYSARRDSGPTLATSIHLFFDYGVQAFRLTTRFGGQPHLTSPIDSSEDAGGSSNQKSHFVQLAERA